MIQIAEWQLANAEEAYRLDPSDANQRRIMKAWSAMRRARDAQRGGRTETPPGVKSATARRSEAVLAGAVSAESEGLDEGVDFPAGAWARDVDRVESVLCGRECLVVADEQLALHVR